MHLLDWLGRHDPGYRALRRAARTAIVMPLLFAFSSVVVRNTDIATFAAFGSIAFLLFPDFAGGVRERTQGVAGLALAGTVLVTLATLASGSPSVAAAAMAVAGFAIVFVGVVSSVLAGCSTSLLLAFVLPVATSAAPSAIPGRVGGWLLAAAAALVAVNLLWPAPVHDRLQDQAAQCCRLLANRQRTYRDYVEGTATRDDFVAAAENSATAVEQLRTDFYAVPNRPTGLSTTARTLVRLVDELGWLALVLERITPEAAAPRSDPSVLAVKAAAADVLDACAALLESRGGDTTALHESRRVLTDRLTALDETAVMQVAGSAGPLRPDQAMGALGPAFRAQEAAFAIREIGANTERAVRAESRSWWEQLTGRQVDGVASSAEAAWERARAHLDLRSVWLHNSVRAGIGLGLAVLVADLSGVQHSFWVVLGALSVLRTSALATGQNVLRALLGTTIGIVIGGVIVAFLGADPRVLWVLLPICLLVAGLLPSAVSFAAGQAAFTVTIVILFNIISPVGYQVGLLRVEDVAIGCAVSLVAGALFWPRGAAVALGRALADAYGTAAAYLTSAVAYGIGRCEGAVPTGPDGPASPTAQAQAAAAAGRRLDDAFREYLAERGSKRLPLGEVSRLVTGAVAPRLAGDAVLDLWARHDCEPGGREVRTRSGPVLTSAAEEIQQWYGEFGRALQRDGPVPEPATSVDLEQQLEGAVTADLGPGCGLDTPAGIRLLWTADHLDALRRLQSSLVAPAAEVARA